MGRPKKHDLEPFKLQLLSMRQTINVDKMLEWLTFRGVSIPRSSLYRQLKNWDSIKQCRTEDSFQLRGRIAVLFYDMCLQDKDMLKVLLAEGFQVTETGLARLRLELGLKRRILFRNREEADQLLLEIVQTELSKGIINDYGRGHLYTYFRTNQHLVSR